MKIQLPAIDIKLLLKFSPILLGVFLMAFVGTSCSFLESASLGMVAFAASLLINGVDNLVHYIFPNNTNRFPRKAKDDDRVLKKTPKQKNLQTVQSVDSIFE